MHTRSIEPWLHEHVFGQDKPKAGERRTLVVIGITAVTMTVEIVAWWVFGSMALLADGVHMASHASALTISAFAYFYTRRHAKDKRFNFGTGKVNSLAAFASAVLLAIFALVMAWESFHRLLSPVGIQFNQAIAVAVAGLLVNGVCMLILKHRPEHQAHGSHSHAHSNHERHDAHEHGDHALWSAYLHVLADALTSVLAIVALLSAKYAGQAWLAPLWGSWARHW